MKFNIGDKVKGPRFQKAYTVLDTMQILDDQWVQVWGSWMAKGDAMWIAANKLSLVKAKRKVFSITKPHHVTLY